MRCWLLTALAVSFSFDWSDANKAWQDQHPHPNEAVLVKQCQMVTAEGTGTRCMVYRNTELALQWQETSRAAMTAENVEKGWFLRFKTQAACDAAAPCNIAAYHNIANQSAPLVPCNKHAPISAPNCAMCCNFSRGYNEPIGGPWPPTPTNNGTRFGNNALNDGCGHEFSAIFFSNPITSQDRLGTKTRRVDKAFPRTTHRQFFWDFRNTDAQDYWAEKVCLQGAEDSSVSGMFTDDPSGYGAEHPAVQSAVQLSDAEIASLQAGTQQAWMKALLLLTKAKKYIPQAYRTTPPFIFNATDAGVASCSAWMRQQCALPANESTQVYPRAYPTLETGAETRGFRRHFLFPTTQSSKEKTDHLPRQARDKDTKS
jgi:hypothetical protein|eukprot:COSAG06_NODE_765_length_12475_cov_85.409502_12_plen_371_part_00